MPSARAAQDRVATGVAEYNPKDKSREWKTEVVFFLTTLVGYSQIKRPELKAHSGFRTFNSELSLLRVLHYKSTTDG